MDIDNTQHTGVVFVSEGLIMVYVLVTPFMRDNKFVVDSHWPQIGMGGRSRSGA